MGIKVSYFWKAYPENKVLCESFDPCFCGYILFFPIGSAEFRSEDVISSEIEDDNFDFRFSGTGFHEGFLEDEKIGDKIAEKVSSKSENENIEVIVRLEPAEPENLALFGDEGRVAPDVAASSLENISSKRQRPIKNFLNRNPQGDILNTFWIANAVLAEVKIKHLENVLRVPYVEKVHSNFEVSLDEVKSIESSYPISSTIEGSEFSEVTWGLERIGAPEVWAVGYDGSGVRVAVSDSGVDVDHPDLRGKLYTEDSTDQYYPGGWIEFDRNGEIVEDSVPHDANGHGTHVSGTIVGANASGEHIGMAPGAELMHALVIPDGEGTFAQTLAGLEWKMDPYDRHGNPAGRPADVANISWGVEEYRSRWEEPIRNLISAGVIPVVSIGNEGEGSVKSPGAIYEALAVGALNRDDEVPDFSGGDIVQDNRSDTPDEYIKPDFSAPGATIKSALPGGEWEYKSGTSMAAPHVSGAISLILEARPSLSADQIRKLLSEFSEYRSAGRSIPDGEEKNTRYGFGIINFRDSLGVEFSNIRVVPSEVYVGSNVI
ncbi:MAG: S8 family serine peptidase [Candidatus Hadarchaeia archaeon]